MSGSQIIQLHHLQSAKPQPLDWDSLPPLALYIHWPWCIKKCPYCDFNSHEARQDIPESAYIDALLRDLELALPSIWGRPIISIFIGGGTPSLMQADSLDRLLAGVRARVPLQPGAEITLEANPGTFELEKFTGFRAAGVNRLSLGIQSFNPEMLQALGRVHNDQEAHHAAQAARELFPTFNLDLMYGLPGQTMAQWQQDLDTALRYQPPHLSLYQLTLEPNTLFYRYPPPLPDDDASADMQDHLEQRTAAQGYQHYETSAFAQPGHQAKHNRNYWQFGDYLGIGAGAHSKISFPDHIMRAMRHKHPPTYMAAVAQNQAVQEQHPIATHDLAFEFMMNALRLNQGFLPGLFKQRTGRPFIDLMPGLKLAQNRQLLEHHPDLIQPTDLGRRFLNEALACFMHDSTTPRPE